MSHRIVGVPEYGGELAVTDSEIVPLGDVFAHREITYTYAGDDRHPAIEAVFQIRNGVPVCAKLAISASADECAVRTKDLAALSIDKMMHDFYALVGVFRPSEDGESLVRVLHFGTSSKSFKRDRKTMEQATSRRKITPEFLQRVAEIYETAPAGATVETIRSAFGVTSDRQAMRYIVQARKEGYIK